MRLLSLLGLSYAAVATALTNVGFGGKRGSNKHFQDLDLGLDCDSDRLGAVAIAFVLGAQNLAAIPGGAPNLALARLAGWEYWLRGDGNSRGCFIQSCATPCRRRNRERTRAVHPSQHGRTRIRKAWSASSRRRSSSSGARSGTTTGPRRCPAAEPKFQTPSNQIHAYAIAAIFVSTQAREQRH